MLPKNNRITKGLFDEILKKGAVIHSPLFLFRVTKQPETVVRAAFVASKKVAASAVVRNTLRRRGYAALRHVLSEGKAHPFNGIFFFKKGSIPASAKEIREDIRSILVKSGIL